MNSIHKMIEYRMLILLLLCALYSKTHEYSLREPLIQTQYGYVRGSIDFSRNLREFTSFRGIPYAKPPVGELRFQSPQPPENWEFPVDATKESPYCIQKNYFFEAKEVEGEEDCLYLNIYVPTTKQNKPLPVMVFIHWGGFFAGRGTSDYMGPEYFMDRDVILITFNYRLGVLGFLTTLDDAAPGNFGLKDQVLALKFVKNNIEYFGGDPNKITIFGQSAGSGSTSLHLISPASKGLFQQAISQSGVALDLWAKPLNVLQLNVTYATAAAVGCQNQIGNNIELIECLRRVDAPTLVASGDVFKYFSIEPPTPYSLVTEKRTKANPDPFITKEPLEYLQAGEFQKVPWIVGTAQDEGILRAAPLLRQSRTREVLNANFTSLVPQMLVLALSVGPESDSLLKNITDFYLGGKNFVDINSPQSIQGFINMYTDRAFAYGIYQAIILQSLQGHNKIWFYNFDYRGDYSYGDLFAATSEEIDFNWGVSHCDDLLYLFKSPALFPEIQRGHDLCMSENLLTLWTNFATYGHPDPDLLFNWNNLEFRHKGDIKNDNLSFLNITGNSQDGVKFKIQKGFHKERMLFWVNQTLAENFPLLG